MNILELLRGISYNDADKVVLRLPNVIDSIRSKHNDPELYGHALIMKWLGNHEGSERQAINKLAMAFKESNLGSYATKLQHDGQQIGLLQPHSLQSYYPTYPLTQVFLQQLLQLQILQATLAQQVQMSPHLVSQMQPTQVSSQEELLQILACSSSVQSSQLTQEFESAKAESPQLLSQSLQVQQSQASSHLSQVKSPQSLPQFSTALPPQSRGQLPVSLQSVTTINKKCNGYMQGVTANILANCDACKDFEMCKRVLIKGIKRGLVTCHLSCNGCTGFKLVNVKSHHHLKHRPTFRQRIYIKCHQTRTHHKISHLKCRLTLDQHMQLKRLLTHDHHRHFKLHQQCCHLKNCWTCNQYIRFKHQTEKRSDSSTNER